MTNSDNRCVRIFKSISDTNFSRLIDLVDNTQFGSITLIIQDGKVVQIDKNEKIRLI